MNILKHKLIVYDGDCPLCSRLLHHAVRWNIVAEGDCSAFYNLPPAYAARVDAERFRSEMALVDTTGGATLYGIEGLREVAALRYPLLRPLLSLRFVQVLLHALYGIIAPNRYVLSTPPARPFACACAPVVSAGTRLRYIILAHLLSVAATATFAIAVRPLVPEVPLVEYVLWVLLATGTGWALYLAVAAAAHPSLFIDHWAHMASVMWRGALVLTPLAILALFSVHSAVAALLCIAASLGVMAFQHTRRIRALALPAWWSVLWLLLLVGSALWWSVFLLPF